MDTTTPDTDLDFVVVDCTQPVDLRNCGMNVPANWAAPELRAQQAAMRKERESVFNVSAAERKALQSRPIEATLFDLSAGPRYFAGNITFMSHRKLQLLNKDAERIHATKVEQQAKVRKVAPSLGIVFK